MSPKIPRKPPVTIPRTDVSISTPKIRHDSDTVALIPRVPWPHDANTPSTSRPGHSAHPDVDATLVAGMDVTNLPHGAGTERLNSNSSSSIYWTPESFRPRTSEADADGFRFIVGRKFIDIEHEGGLHLAHVGLDETLGFYRLKLLTEQHPSGPIVYRNDTGETWRLTEHASKKPDESIPRDSAPKRPAPSDSELPGTSFGPKQTRPSDTPNYINLNHYKRTWRSPDAQGYFEFVSQFGLGAPGTLMAFEAPFGQWIQVDPPVGGFGSQPTHLKSWTDAQIWELYGIHGQDIERFRVEVQLSGKPPQWVEPNARPNSTVNLLRDSLRWMHPTMSAVERQALLQSYNLLPSQQLRLQQDLKTDLTLPQWVLSHQRLIEDIDNPNRLDQFSKDAIDELNLRRDARHDWYDPEKSLTRELREALLPKMGYLRNQNNLLYRTDVPALFRGDDRVPFELARDNAMLPRHGHEPGATTHKPMSATFSLDAARMYGGRPDPDYLRFNSQANKYPGRSTDDTPSDTDASDVESSDSDWSDIGSPVDWDRERDYERIRERQNIMFLYALDTRGKEVVPREENSLFNSAAQKRPAWFPEDDYEGLVSVTKKGMEADRIWLLNSALTKGAKVKDIEELAGNRADRIEESTYEGSYNNDEYDNLIDQVEAAGHPILKLSGKGNEFADDVRWP